MPEGEDKSEEDKKKEEEEKAEEEKKKKEAEGDINFVKDAKEAAALVKAENDRKEKLIERDEKLVARKEALNALGGGSPAGDRSEGKEETPLEYMKKVMSGEIETS